MSLSGWGPGRCAAIGALALALLLPASAAAGSQCNANGLCVEENLGLQTTPGPLVAAAPLSIDVTAENTSSPLTTNRWLETVSLSIVGPDGSPPRGTPSAQLPEGLLIAGPGSCTAPTYTDCPGGHGTLDATLLGFVSTTGAYGISEIVNDATPPTGVLVDYRATVKWCVVEGGTCKPKPDRTEELTLGTNTGGEFSFPAGGSEPGVEYALRSLSFHLNGQSSQKDTGSGAESAGGNFTIVAASLSCGSLTGTSEYSSRAEGSVAFQHTYTVTGCPTAAFAPYRTPGGSTIELDGSPSSASIGGRSVKTWKWNFGDGTSAETTKPTVVHEFAPASEPTVTLYVVDDAGARSAAVAQQVAVPGHRLTVSLAGAGGGSVTGGGIDCPPTCSAAYLDGASVTLTATPDSHSSFAGWGGDCAGAGTCDLTMSSDRTVTATFSQPSGGGGGGGGGLGAAPPDTRIAKAKLRPRPRFWFSAAGSSTGFECALSRKRAKPVFRSCRSPKSYGRLRPGRYTFSVRAVGPDGADSTPAHRSFRVRPSRR